MGLSSCSKSYSLHFYIAVYIVCLHMWCVWMWKVWAMCVSCNLQTFLHHLTPSSVCLFMQIVTNFNIKFQFICHSMLISSALLVTCWASCWKLSANFEYIFARREEERRFSSHNDDEYENLNFQMKNFHILYFVALSGSFSSLCSKLEFAVKFTMELQERTKSVRWRRRKNFII